MLSTVTPLILTYNEAPNLRRGLEKLQWASEVVIVDSFSNDETEQIARSFPKVRFVQRQFDNHAAQWNFGLDQIDSDWVLSLDADYVVTDELVNELSQLAGGGGVSVFFARFRYCVAGHTLRGSLYPPRAVLFRKSECRYVQDGHTQVLDFRGPSKFLQGYLLHDDRKPLARWLDSQRAYARLEAEKLLSSDPKSHSLPDRLRRWILPAAPAALVYAFIVKGCLLDGWPGWFYALQRTYAELLLSLEMLDRQLAGGATSDPASSNRAEQGFQPDAVGQAPAQLRERVSPEGLTYGSQRPSP
jgi:glycosyltransferase involved in cell wall biosynthesis